MRTSIILTAASVLFLFGCGSDPGRSPRESMISSKKSGKEAAAPQAKEGGPQEPGAGRQEPAEPTPRKIIYTSQVEMVVEDLEHSETELKRLIQEEKAYVAKSELHGSMDHSGSLRSSRFISGSHRQIGRASPKHD
jgi:hypothetical protein